MLLFRHVIDKELVDRHGHKCGKVDDIVLEIRPHEPPAVRAILTGQGALIPILPKPVARLATWLERCILGSRMIEPRTVAWEHVTHIDVVVQLEVDRQEAGLLQTQQAIARRFIEPIPGAGR